MTRRFGTLPDGRDVEVLHLSDGPLSVSILTLGAILQDVRLAGVAHALTLGSPDLAAYLGPMASFGAVMGPVANRIGGARAILDGRELRFEPRPPHGHCLHGGSAGTHRKLWEVVAAGPARATLAVTLPDGEGGFPGTRRIEATYAVTGASLSLTLTAVTDAPTPMNLAHHGYWTMDGAPTWEGHLLQIHADRWLPTDATSLPSGEVAPVAGTGHDFRAGVRISPGRTPPLDHNFCLADARGPLRPAVALEGRSGVRLEVGTTEPGVQIFGMGHIDCADAPTHHPHPYGPHAGVAIEPQFWPDAMANPGFPGIVLRPGAPWRQDSVWHFSAPVAAPDRGAG